MTGKKLASIFLILALLVDVTGHSVAFGVGLRAHDGGTSKGVAVAPYIEDVFSSYLYTGNGSAQTITNGIDLAGKGGLVWIKNRDSGTRDHFLYSNSQSQGLSSNLTSGENYFGTGENPVFTSAGFDIVTTNTSGYTNGASPTKFASWTFRKAPKFFDVVTYTGNGSAPRALNHSLGVRPGMVIIKRTDLAGNWWVTHRSAPNQGAAYTDIGGNLYLDTTDPADTGANPALSGMNAATITLSTNQNAVLNINAATYVAYLFAHDASSSGVIQAGSFTSIGATRLDIDLGWQPQFVMIKRANGASQWYMMDNMRGFPAVNVESSNDPASKVVYANLSNAEAGYGVALRTNGFSMPAGQFAGAGETYIYLAIRRGPMRTPTSGTQVFLTNDGGGSITGDSVAVGFPVDAAVTAYKTLGGAAVDNRLSGYGTANTAGASPYMFTSGNIGEPGYSGSNPYFYNAWNTTIVRGSNGGNPGGGIVTWFFRRAPGVFDVVAYPELANPGTISHGLGVVPEMIITKIRNENGPWHVYHKDINPAQANPWPHLEGAEAGWAVAALFPSVPTTSSFVIDYTRGITSRTHVAYLFASKAGVSKVGSYTGNGASQTINANFTAGARFILIKRTDSAGDWFVWDSVRGIVAGNDPHYSLNTGAIEVTTDDSVDPDNGGFVVNQNAATNINVNGGTYIYLAFQ